MRPQPRLLLIPAVGAFSSREVDVALVVGPTTTLTEILDELADISRYASMLTDTDSAEYAAAHQRMNDLMRHLEVRR